MKTLTLIPITGLANRFCTIISTLAADISGTQFYILSV